MTNVFNFNIFKANQNKKKNIPIFFIKKHRNSRYYSVPTLGVGEVPPYLREVIFKARKIILKNARLSAKKVKKDDEDIPINLAELFDEDIILLPSHKEEMNSIIEKVVKDEKEMYKVKQITREYSFNQSEETSLYLITKPFPDDYNFRNIYAVWNLFDRTLTSEEVQKSLDKKVNNEFQIFGKDIIEFMTLPDQIVLDDTQSIFITKENIGPSFAEEIDSVLDKVINDFKNKSKVHNKRGDVKYPINYNKFIDILERNKRGLVNRIIVVVTTITLRSNSPSIISIPIFITVMSYDIEKQFFGNNISWFSFGGKPTQPPSILAYFFSRFLFHLFNTSVHISIKKAGQIYNLNNYIKVNNTVFLCFSDEKTKRSLRWSQIRFSESYYVPRLKPFNNWEIDKVNGGIAMNLDYYKDNPMKEIGPRSRYNQKIDSQITKELASIINNCQKQPWYVCRKSFVKLLNSGPIFSGRYYKNDSTRMPLFGSSEGPRDYIIHFLKFFCYPRALPVDENSLRIFVNLFYTEITRKYITSKRNCYWLFLFIKLNRPIYFPYNIDFRSRDACSGFIHPLNSKISKYCLYFRTVNSDAEFLSEKGIMIIASYIYNILYPKKLTNHSQVIEAIFDKKTPTPELLQNWVVNQEAFIDNQEMYLQYISVSTKLEPGKYGTIQNSSVYLDASSSVLQILVAITNDFTKVKIVNIINSESGDYQDPYQVFGCPSSIEIDRNKALGSISRKVIKAFFIQTIYGSSKFGIIHTFCSEFKIREQVARECYKYLNNSFENIFERQIEFLNYIKESCTKNKDTDNIRVELSFPLYKVSYMYIKTKTVRPRFDYGGDTFRSSINIRSHECDTDKNDKSFFANFVQGLDAHVKNRVVQSFQKRSLPIFAVHDCFRVHPNYADIAIIAYNEALIEISSLYEKELTSLGFSKFTPDELDKIKKASFSISSF